MLARSIDFLGDPRMNELIAEQWGVVRRGALPGHLGRHAGLRGICVLHARGRKADRPSDLQGGPVRIGLLSDLPAISVYLYRALSTAFVVAVIFWTVTAVRRRRPALLTRAGIVIVIWAASIATTAGVHTLDVWRYLVPAVPMVGLMLSRNDRMPAEGLIAPLASCSSGRSKKLPRSAASMTKPVDQIPVTTERLERAPVTLAYFIELDAD